jgi:hypothetical protein
MPMLIEIIEKRLADEIWNMERCWRIWRTISS